MDSDAAAPVRTTFLSALRTGVRPRDAVGILTVPVVLVAVFFLPYPVRESLVFRYSDPSIVSAFVSPFVHLDLTHLLVNLTGYVLVVTVVYGLDVLSGRRERFAVVFATFLLSFPLLLSYLHLAAFRPAGSVGFSGVVMAFVGYLPIALADCADGRFGRAPTRAAAPVLFFVGFALIAVLSVVSVVPRNVVVLLGISQLVVATVLAAVLFGLPILEERGRLRSRLARAADAPGYFELMGVGAFVFMTFPLVAFPPKPVSNTATVNLYTHLIGFSLGFIVVYATLSLTDRLPIDEPTL
jgi:membrane associated rhomboid family serine protease